MSDYIPMNTIDENIHNLDEVYGIIYIFRFPNGKNYIGQTKQYPHTKYSKRITGHISTAKNDTRNGLFYNALRKFITIIGENKIFDIIEIIDYAYSFDELNELEKHYIKKYNSSSRDEGYNLTLGGEGTNGFVPNQHQRLMMSIRQTQIMKDNLKEHSEKMKISHNKSEYKEKISQIQKERNKKLENRTRGNPKPFVVYKINEQNIEYIGKFDYLPYAVDKLIKLDIFNEKQQKNMLSGLREVLTKTKTYWYNMILKYTDEIDDNWTIEKHIKEIKYKKRGYHKPFVVYKKNGECFGTFTCASDVYKKFVESEIVSISIKKESVMKSIARVLNKHSSRQQNLSCYNMFFKYKDEIYDV